MESDLTTKTIEEAGMRNAFQTAVLVLGTG